MKQARWEAQVELSAGESTASTIVVSTRRVAATRREHDAADGDFNARDARPTERRLTEHPPAMENVE